MQEALVRRRAGLHHVAEEGQARARRRARVLLGWGQVEEEVGLDEGLGRGVEEGNVLWGVGGAVVSATKRRDGSVQRECMRWTTRA